MPGDDLDFETQYECCYCQCGDERLELEWNEESLSFTAECGCMKQHDLKPTKCTIETIETIDN